MRQISSNAAELRWRLLSTASNATLRSTKGMPRSKATKSGQMWKATKSCERYRHTSASSRRTRRRCVAWTTAPLTAPASSCYWHATSPASAPLCKHLGEWDGTWNHAKDSFKKGWRLWTRMTQLLHLEKLGRHWTRSKWQALPMGKTRKWNKQDLIMGRSEICKD